MEISHNVVRHDVEIEMIQRELRELRGEVKEIVKILSRAQGSWKAMLAMGGFASAVASLVTAFMTKILSAGTAL